MHIELIATNGKIQKRVLWVDVTSNGVYTGLCSKGKNLHISYHADGNVFHNWFDGKPKKTLTLAPLNAFKGYHQLVCNSFSNKILNLLNVPTYTLSKLDAIVNVDIRSYKHGLGCMVFIVEPNNHALLSKMIEGLPQDLVTETHSFLRCNPWISLVLYDK